MMIINYIYTGGQTDITMSIGFGSYNFTSGKFSTFSTENSWLENLGYGFGALGNVADVLAGLNPGEVTLRTENDPNYSTKGDYIGHSQITNETDVLIDWGPVNGAGVTDWVPGTNSYKDGLFIQNLKDSQFWDPITIKGVNIKTMNWYKGVLDKGGTYNLLFNNCVSKTSMALNLSGVLNIGIHPYVLHTQMYLWSNGIRPWSFSYLLNRQR